MIVRPAPRFAGPMRSFGRVGPLEVRFQPANVCSEGVQV